MFNISSFLEKISKQISSTKLHKKQILEIIEKQTQIKLSEEQIEIKNYIVYTQASPGIKNKIFIYKEKILDDISQTLSLKIVDIR